MLFPRQFHWIPGPSRPLERAHQERLLERAEIGVVVVVSDVWKLEPAQLRDGLVREEEVLCGTDGHLDHAALADEAVNVTIEAG